MRRKESRGKELVAWITKRRKRQRKKVKGKDQKREQEIVSVRMKTGNTRKENRRNEISEKKEAVLKQEGIDRQWKRKGNNRKGERKILHSINGTRKKKVGRKDDVNNGSEISSSATFDSCIRNTRPRTLISMIFTN